MKWVLIFAFFCIVINGCAPKGGSADAGESQEAPTLEEMRKTPPQRVMAHLFVNDRAPREAAAEVAQMPDAWPANQQKLFNPTWKNFTPLAVKVPIFEISVYAYNGFNEQLGIIQDEIIYQCPSTSPEDCMIELNPDTGFRDLLSSLAVELPENFTPGGVTVTHCRTDTGFTQYVKGSVELRGVRYRTSPQGLVADGAAPEFEGVTNRSCARDIKMHDFTFSWDSKFTHLNLFMDLNDYAWTGVGYYESYVASNSGFCNPSHLIMETTPVLCANYPDYVVTTHDRSPIVERYAMHGARGVFDSTYQFYTSTKTSQPLTGFARKFFWEGHEIYDFAPSGMSIHSFTQSAAGIGFKLNLSEWDRAANRQTQGSAGYAQFANGSLVKTGLYYLSTSPAREIPNQQPRTTFVRSRNTFRGLRAPNMKDRVNTISYPSKPSPYPPSYEEKPNCFWNEIFIDRLAGGAKKEVSSYNGQSNIAFQFFTGEISRTLSQIEFRMDWEGAPPLEVSAEIRQVDPFNCPDGFFCPSETVTIATTNVLNQEQLVALGTNGGVVKLNLQKFMELGRRTIFFIVVRVKRSNGKVFLYSGSTVRDEHDLSMERRDQWFTLLDTFLNYKLTSCQ